MVYQHQLIVHCGPGEAVLVQPLVGHHQTGCVLVKQLQTVRLSRSQHKDRPGERVPAQLVLHHRGQAVVTLAEVDGLRGNHEPNPVRREDHEQARIARAS